MQNFVFGHNSEFCMVTYHFFDINHNVIKTLSLEEQNLCLFFPPPKKQISLKIHFKTVLMSQLKTSKPPVCTPERRELALTTLKLNCYQVIYELKYSTLIKVKVAYYVRTIFQAKSN